MSCLRRYGLGYVFVFLFTFAADASVESSMQNLQSKLLSILPLMSVLGLIFAGFCYLVGSPNARAYMWYAIFGAVIGFGAESIVAFIRGIVN